VTPPAAAAEPRPASPLTSAHRHERVLWTILGLGTALVLATAATRGHANVLLGVGVAGLVIVAYQRVLLAWETMLALILVVILFIPIRRYTVGASLPIELEPYRIVIALVLMCWFCALAVDPRVRWRRTGLEGPIAALLLVILLSLVANIGRVNAASEIVVKQVSFFLSYFIVVYFVASVIRSRRDVDRMLTVLVGGATIVAVLALIEWRTGNNLFNWYSRVMPFLQYVDEGLPPVRGNGVRARGSAQHSIALGAALVMMIPLAVYLYRRDRRKVWLVCVGLLTLGALSTGSRTGTLMLIALLVSFLCIKPRDTVRLLPMLVPLVVVIQVVMPGTLGTMKSLLNPSYVIKEQSYDKGSGAGRVADLGPALERWSRQPFLGSGFGTKIADPNAQAGSDQQILDNQWLGSLLEIGAFGVLALLWLYVRAIRRLAARARSDTGPDGWLAMGLAAALISLAVGMFTFDAFAFVQVTFLSFILLGFAAATVVAEGARPLRRPRQAARDLLRAAMAAR
jgi:polysaccharide biosynthesis protein PslJ